MCAYRQLRSILFENVATFLKRIEWITEDFKAIPQKWNYDNESSSLYDFCMRQLIIFQVVFGDNQVETEEYLNIFDE